MWAVTRRGNRLVEMLGVALEQVEENFGWSLSRVESRFLRPQGSGSRCGRPQPPAANQIAAEDLSHLSQLVRPRFVSGGRPADAVTVSSFLLQNGSNGASVAAECRLHLPASGALKVTLRGRLQLPALLAVSFRSLEVLTTASIQMEPSSPMFLQEDVALREVRGRQRTSPPPGWERFFLYTCCCRRRFRPNTKVHPEKVKNTQTPSSAAPCW